MRFFFAVEMPGVAAAASLAQMVSKPSMEVMGVVPVLSSSAPLNMA